MPTIEQLAFLAVFPQRYLCCCCCYCLMSSVAMGYFYGENIRQPHTTLYRPYHEGIISVKVDQSTVILRAMSPLRGVLHTTRGIIRSPCQSIHTRTNLLAAAPLRKDLFTRVSWITK